MKKFKGQASIIDALAFMTLVGVSIALLFAMVSNYGDSQDKILRSSYTLNYMESVIKELYHLDVSMLKDVTPEITKNPAGGAAATLNAGPTNCNDLKDFKGRISVMDVLKMDVSEYSPAKTMPLDNKFGSTNKYGITALHCALRELMKPFSIAGYHYLAEIVIGKTGLQSEQNLFAGYLQKIENANPSDPTVIYQRISNSQYISADTSDETKGLKCETVKRITNTADLIVVTTPFVVRDPDTQMVHTVLKPITGEVAGFMKLRICVWPATSAG